MGLTDLVKQKTVQQIPKPPEEKKGLLRKVGGFVKEVGKSIVRPVVRETVRPFVSTYAGITGKRGGINIPVAGEIKPYSELSGREALGAGLELGVTALTFGVGGAGIGVGKAVAKTAATQGVKLATKELVRRGAKLALTDALIGGGFGVSTALQDKEATGKDILTAGLTGAALGAAIPPVLGKTLKVFGKGAKVVAGRAGGAIEKAATKLESMSFNALPKEGERYYQRLAEAKPTMGEKIAGAGAGALRGLQKFPAQVKTALVDKLDAIKRFQETVQKKLGIDVPDIHEMAASARYRAAGKAEQKLDEYVAIRESYGDDWNNVKEYSHYLDDLDRLANGNKIAGGRNLKDVEDDIEKFRSAMSPTQKTFIEQGQKDLQTFLNKELEDAVASGRLSKEGFDAIKKAHPNYVPHDVLDFLEDAGGQGLGRSFQMTKSGIEHAKGSERAIDDIDKSVVRRLYRQNLLNEKNKVMNTVIDMGMPEEVIETATTKSQLTDTWNEANKVVPEAQKAVAEGAKDATKKPPTEELKNTFGFIKLEKDIKTVDIPKGFEKVSRFKDGIKEEWLVPEDLGKAFENVDGQASGQILNWINNTWAGKIITAPARFIRKMATGINPVFALWSNPMRDVQNVQITAKMLPQDYAKGLASSIAGNTGKADELYQLAQKSGALQGSIYREEQEAEKILARKLNKQSWFQKITRPDKIIEDAGQMMEESTRLGVFHRAMKDGETIEQAAKTARNASVDFGKSGTWTEIVNKFIPFLNARTQGFYNLGTALAKDPTKFVRQQMYTAAAPAAFLFAHNNKYESYQSIPNYEKQQNWIIMVGQQEGNDFTGKKTIIPNYVKIRKGEGQIAIAALLERMLNIGAGNKDFVEGTNKFLEGLIGNISPITESSILPAGIQQAIEVKANYSFFKQGQIEPDYIKKDGKWYKTSDIEPMYRSSEQATSEVAKGLGKIFNWSPYKIDHVIKTGLINDLIRMYDISVKGFRTTEDGKFQKATELPFLKSVIGSSTYGATQREKDAEQKKTREATTKKIKARENITAPNTQKTPPQQRLETLRRK